MEGSRWERRSICSPEWGSGPVAFDLLRRDGEDLTYSR
jgi:hypothetical protein